jgi:cell wall-associated NlpC family hydrolase
MTIDTSGPMAVQARIAAIQARFAQSGVYASASAVPSTSQSVDFADTLTALTGTPSTTDGTDGTSGTGNGTASGDLVVADAQKYLGVPYLWGGTDPAKGLDCSGLVQLVYKDLGIQLPRVSQDQARAGTAVPSLAQAKPGDLLAFGSPADHIAIYLGNNQMIDAPKTGDVVKVQSVYETPSSIRRILPHSSASSTSLSSMTSLASLTSASAATSATHGSAASATSSPAMAAAPAAYRSLFQQAGTRYGVSPDLLAAVAQTESAFNPRAVSSAGARGLMQIMPATARTLGVDPNNPAQAVDGAARLLAQNLRSFGSTTLALAAYNAGPGAVTRYHGVPPYAETRSYITKVLAAAGRSA